MSNLINPYQLPNNLRESMLQAGFAKSLLVLEGLYLLKLKANRWLTFVQIYRLCRDNFGSGYQLAYRGLRQANIFQRRKSQRVPNQRGARPYLYRIPHPDELIAEFNLGGKYSPYDELQKTDLKSVTAYRKALHREMFIRKWVVTTAKALS